MIDKTVNDLNIEKLDAVSKVSQEDAETIRRKEEEYERITYAFFEQIFERNIDLIDNNHFERYFKMIVALNPSQLMYFMQRINKKWPINAEKICEENGLIVEQAYILLEQGQEQ